MWVAVTTPTPTPCSHALRLRRRARRRRAAEVRDLLSDGDARLDDRMRTAAAACLDGIVGALDRMIRARAIADLTECGANEAAAQLSAAKIDMTSALADGGILSETSLIEEVLGRVGEALLTEGLPMQRLPMPQAH